MSSNRIHRPCPRGMRNETHKAHDWECEDGKYWCPGFKGRKAE